MEPEVNQTSPDTNPLQDWWTSTDFPGKQYTSLAEDGTLMLNAAGGAPARPLGALSPEKADAYVQALEGKFSEVKARVEEVQKEWESTEDKQKLASKVSRLNDYLLHAPAIGDYAPLLAQGTAWQQEISAAQAEGDRAREALVAKAEQLGQSTEWKETTQAFRDLTEEWRKLGNSGRAGHDALWARIETARESFHERKRQAHEEQEKEMLQNLDIKLELVAKAEAAAASETWKQTTELFKNLMEQWKATGRTMAEKNEALWQRFIAAQNHFFDRKRLHTEEVRVEQEANYAAKLALVEQAEAMAGSQEWNKTGDAFDALMDKWKKTGHVPAEKADELWDRLRAAKDTFFGARRVHRESVRVSQEDNLAQKQALVKRAEELKETNAFGDATQEFNELMDAWKKIGHVPRKEADRLWEAFIGARRHFFARKDADRDRRRAKTEEFRDRRRAEDEAYEARRLGQTREFLKTLQDELADDQERINEFRDSLAGMPASGGSKKDEALRQHLQKLVAELEGGLGRKGEKIKSVEKQLAEMESKQRRPQPAATGRKEGRPDNRPPAEATAPATDAAGEAHEEIGTATLADATGTPPEAETGAAAANVAGGQAEAGDAAASSASAPDPDADSAPAENNEEEKPSAA